MSDDRGITYTDDTGIIYYRASGFGSCPRALYASRRGYTPEPYPAPVLQAFADGNANEDHIRQLIEAQGWLTYDHQDEVSFKLGPVVVVGHIDWMIKDPTHDAGPYVCDAKALSDSNFKKWRTYGFEAFPKYAWQLSIYARAKKADICMAVLNKETDELDVSFHPAPHTFSNMLERVIEIERYVRDGNADQPACEPDGFYCPFSFLHDTMFDDVSLSGGMDQLRQNKLWDLASQYQSAKRAETVAKNKASELLHDIEVALHADEKNVKVRKTGAAKTIAIVRVNQKRKTVDSELLGAYLRSQSHSLTEFETTKESSYIRVTSVKKEDTPDAAPATIPERLGENPTDGGTGDVKDNVVAEHSEVVT